MLRIDRFSFLLLVSLVVFPGSSQAGITLNPKTGIASYYGPSFHGKCCTANGEQVNMYALTAAHRTLPFGTKVKVTNVKNGKSVVVRINDRGPYDASRVIDLSLAAFQQIASPRKGTVQVRLQLKQLPQNLPGMKPPAVRP